MFIDFIFFLIWVSKVPNHEKGAKFRGVSSSRNSKLETWVSGSFKLSKLETWVSGGFELSKLETWVSRGFELSKLETLGSRNPSLMLSNQNAILRSNYFIT